MKRLLTPVLIIVGIAAFLANALYQVKSAGNVPAFTLRTTDTYIGYLPCLTFARNSLLHGSFPLWDPHAAAGVPFFGNLGVGMTCPINWTILLFDVPLAMLINQGIIVCIAIAGTILYARYLKLGWPEVVLAAALFGSVVLMESFSLAFASAQCWFPYILWAAHRLFDRPSYGRSVLLAVAFALCFLAGYVQYFYYICIMTAVYVGLLMVISRSEHRPRGLIIRGGLIALALFLSIGLVSIQLIPTLELSLSSVRSASANLDPHTVHWLDKFSLMKLFHYAVTRSSPVNRLNMPYLGVGLFLVPFALFSKKHKKAAIPLLAALCYAILFVVAKETGSFAFLGKLPLSNAFRWHVRFITVTHLLTAVLAAIGLSVLLNRPFNGLREPGTGKLDKYGLFILLYMLVLLIPIGMSMRKLIGLFPHHIVAVFPGVLFLALLVILLSEMQVKMKAILAAGGLLLFFGMTLRWGDIFNTDSNLVILLPGIGLLIAHFLHADRLRRWRVLSLCAAGGLIILGMVLQDKFEAVSSSLIILTAGLIFSRHAPELPRWMGKAIAWLVLLFLLVDVMPYRNYRATVPAFTRNTTDVFDRQLDWIRANAGYDRVYMNPGGYPYIHLAANAGSMYGFYGINSFYSFTLARWEHFVRQVIGEENFNAKYGYWRFHGYIESDMEKFFLTKPDLDGIASLRYLLTCFPLSEKALGKNWRLKYRSDPTEPEYYVYENRLALPRAYLVDSYVQVPNSEEKSLLMTARLAPKLTSLVVLEDAAPSFPSAADSTGFSGQAQIVRYENEEVELRVGAQSPSLLVLTDNFYPGWTATVDGVKTPIWRANSLFRAVEVPAGSHTVVFRYRPASLRWGAAISGLTLLLMMAGFLIKRRFSRTQLKPAQEPVPEPV